MSRELFEGMLVRCRLDACNMKVQVNAVFGIICTAWNRLSG